MKAIRLTVATLLIACAVPVSLLATAWAASKASGCALQFDEPHVCRFASTDIGWLLDALTRFGVWGALTLGLGAYVFAAWVLVELVAIIHDGLRRG